MLTAIALTILAFALLLMGWLSYDRGLTSIEAWQDQLGKWRQSLETAVHPATLVDQPNQHYGGTSSPRSVPEPLPESEILLESEPGPDTTTLTQAEPLVEPEPEPEPEPLAQPEALIEPAPEPEPVAISPSQARDSAPDSEALLSSTASSESEEDLGGSTAPSSLQIIFDFDSAELSENAKESLDDIARTFILAGSGRIRVMGYADERGDRNYNIALSRRRANTVAQYLIDNGLDRKSLVVLGRGIYEESPGSPSLPGTEGRIVQLEVQTDELAYDAIN